MSFLTSLFGGGGGSVPPGPSSAQTNTATSTLGSTGTSAANFMNSYGQTGSQGLNSGLNNLTPVANWFQTIMNGNKQATLNQMQPQIAQTEGGLNTALQTGSTLAPRGGGRSSTLFDLPFEAQKDIASQYAAARAGAPAGLQSAATAQGALGASAAGAGAQFGQIGNQANNNLLNYGLSQQQQSYTQAQQNGGLWGKLLGPVLSAAIPGIGGLISGAIGGIGKAAANSSSGGFDGVGGS